MQNLGYLCTGSPRAREKSSVSGFRDGRDSPALPGYTEKKYWNEVFAAADFS